MACYVRAMITMGALVVAAWQPALAMGPSAPFIAPQVGQEVDPLQLSAGGADGLLEKGLSGVRTGRYAGAVIDGHWVRKGKTARGARLIKIERNRVTLKHPDGKLETLDLYLNVAGTADATLAASSKAVKP